MISSVIISAICLLIAGFLAWEEISRRNRKNMPARLVASMIAVLSLYFIAVPPAFDRSGKAAYSKSISLVTQGYDPLILRAQRDLPAYTLDSTVAAENRGIELIPGIEHLLSLKERPARIRILGNDITKDQLEALQGIELVLSPGPLKGFIAANWEQEIISGKQVTVQGRYYNETNKPVKLVLKGLNTSLDSMMVKGAVTERFSLKASPKTIGKSVLQLIALSGSDTLASEKVPFVVHPRSALKILILASSPDFESRFFKDWLLTGNHSIAVRNRVSKDKFSTEFLNAEKKDLSRVNNSLLSDFDLIVSDVAELSSLTEGETAILRNEIGTGLGLLMRTDSAYSGSGFFRTAFSVRQRQAANGRTGIFAWSGRSVRKMVAPAASNLEILTGSNQQGIVTDDKNHVLVSTRLFGSGNLTLTTINDSYTWMLADNAEEYASFWTNIIDRTARKRNAENSISPAGQFPLTGRRTPVIIESSGQIPEITVDQIPLRPAQSTARSYLWEADYWPRTPGYADVSVDGKKQSGWYVFKPEEWKNARWNQQIKDARNYIARNPVKAKNHSEALPAYRDTIPPEYLVILLILSCSYLWLEPKLL